MSTQEPTMTEHDTTDHVNAIKATTTRIAEFRHLLGTGEADRLGDELNHLVQHADALAARLAAAEAERDAERERADRWERYGLAFRDYDDAGGSPERHDALAELEAAEDALIEHGDMDGSDDDA